MQYQSRMKELYAQLFSLQCDGLIIEHPTDLFYLTGINLSNGKLLVTQNNALLLVDGR